MFYCRRPSESELFSVGAELDNIGRRVDGLATFTRIDGEESCISRVVEALGKNEWPIMVSQIRKFRSSPRSLYTMDTLQSNGSSGAI